MESIKAKIKDCYERLQTIEVKATLHNLETTLQTLYDLRSAYGEIEEMERGKEDGGLKTNP